MSTDGAPIDFSNPILDYELSNPEKETDSNFDYQAFATAPWLGSFVDEHASSLSSFAEVTSTKALNGSTSPLSKSFAGESQPKGLSESAYTLNKPLAEPSTKVLKNSADSLSVPQAKQTPSTKRVSQSQMRTYKPTKKYRVVTDEGFTENSAAPVKAAVSAEVTSLQNQINALRNEFNASTVSKERTRLSKLISKLKITHTKQSQILTILELQEQLAAKTAEAALWKSKYEATLAIPLPPENNLPKITSISTSSTQDTTQSDIVKQEQARFTPSFLGTKIRFIKVKEPSAVVHDIKDEPVQRNHHSL